MFVIDSNLAGGAERVIAILVNYLAEKKYHVILLNFDKESNFYPINKNVEIIKLASKYSEIERLNNKVIKKLMIIRKTRTEIKRCKPDVVIPFLFASELAVIPYCVRKSIPCITSVRNDANVYPKYQRFFRRHYYPKLSRVVFQSHAVRNHKDYRQLDNSCIIPNPLDMKLIEEREVSIDSNKIISVGRLTNQKNHGLTIQVMYKLVKEYPDLHLHIYGSGPLKEELQNKINKLNLQKNVFLEGVIENAQYVNRDAAAFIMASNFEGFPNALLEAMACHIPSICTNFKSGTAEEALLSGEAGWLIEVGNAIELEHAIRECISNVELAEKKAKLAILQCKKYSVNVIGNCWDEILLQAISERNSH